MVTEAYDSAEHFFDSQPLVFPEPPSGQAAHVPELDAGYVRAVADRSGGCESLRLIASRLIKPDLALSAKGECADIDGQLPCREAAERAAAGAVRRKLQAELLRLRTRYRALGC